MNDREKENHMKDFSYQKAWWIDSVNGSDLADGQTQQTAIKTNAEFVRRVGAPWRPQVNVSVHYVNYPSDGDPLYLDIDLQPRGDGTNHTPTNPIFSQVDFYGPQLPVTSSGSITAITPRNNATNTPYEFTDGAVQTTPNDAGQRFQITSGPRAGTIAWVAKGTGTGKRRISEPCKFDFVNYTQPQIPAVGDAYEILGPNGYLHLGRIRISPTSGAPSDYLGTAVPTAAVAFHGMDLRPAVDNGVLPIENNGVMLTFENCSFNYCEVHIRTGNDAGDNESMWTYLQNCSVTATGAANVWFEDGDFVTNIVEAGCYFGSIGAQDSAGLSLDYNMLTQGHTAFLAAVGEGLLRIVQVGMMDGITGILSSDGVIGIAGGSFSQLSPQIWGVTAGFGAVLRANVDFRYWPGSQITLTGPSGDFQMAGQATARAWDDTLGAYTPALPCTWANLIGGALKDNAHNLMQNVHAYLNPAGIGQAQP
jgi:hypothetical protein